MKILTSQQEEILKIFSTTDDAQQFYLAGGTALAAFYLEHRLSEDLDFFTPQEELVQILGDKLRDALEKAGFQAKTLRKFKTFYELIATKEGESTLIHIAFDAPFRFEPLTRKEFGVKIDTLVDIATNKLLALWGRYAPKDFVDIYFLAKEKFSLEEIIAKAKAKEKDEGLEEYFLALSFHKAKDLPENLKSLPVRMIKELNLKELKDFFVEKSVAMLAQEK
ncbi:hypothetical protein COT42_06520 [Candidatus Saganbacteria bacterium CG08_land_8_20_14_0_20_45_16]|uniref:Nucleotidyl transferase AbiEii/AbiGii toxin family protein n=1 Tax=Candidatus Saganbacteria bacterium CG08_land_8_20_14_0_20_45_16 TaxID=2014293 RepID=A0A2H0XXW3_UNCSA|nr:MAG: hypothetical protein COT42_06520 [Candidatus Saganbacteria bacterium CG08_land_8_20_14_0_20_45_16]